MNPWKVSAQFAAFAWFTNRKSEKPAPRDEAVRFARDNWIAFLPCAHEGYGRLLIEVAKTKPKQKTRRPRVSKVSRRKLAAAS